jgi:hypothetical protein
VPSVDDVVAVDVGVDEPNPGIWISFPDCIAINVDLSLDKEMISKN